MDEGTYAAVPAQLGVREVRVRVRLPGFRTKVLVVTTTLLDAEAFGRRDVALLYRIRWYAEVDLRSLKQAMQMDVLARARRWCARRCGRTCWPTTRCAG